MVIMSFFLKPNSSSSFLSKSAKLMLSYWQTGRWHNFWGLFTLVLARKFVTQSNTKHRFTILIFSYRRQSIDFTVLMYPYIDMINRYFYIVKFKRSIWCIVTLDNASILQIDISVIVIYRSFSRLYMQIRLLNVSNLTELSLDDIDFWTRWGMRPNLSNGCRSNSRVSEGPHCTNSALLTGNDGPPDVLRLSVRRRFLKINSNFPLHLKRIFINRIDQKFDLYAKNHRSGHKINQSVLENFSYQSVWRFWVWNLLPTVHRRKV